MIQKGTDLSSFIPKVDWRQLVIDGYGAFSYARACDGTYVDPMHSTHVRNANANAVPIGSYQYGHPSMDVRKLAEAYLAVVDKAHATGRDRLRHVVDMESLATSVNGQKIVPPNAGEWTDSWCEIVKAETGSEPIIYASLYYFIEMCRQVPTLGGATGWDWWLAWYTGSPNQPKTALPYIAHQYGGDVKLVDQVGLWDLDAVYNDNVDVLRIAA